MLVDPTPGALVRYPASRRAVEPGDIVDEAHPYWARLLLDGDLTTAAAPAAPPPKAAAKAPVEAPIEEAN